MAITSMRASGNIVKIIVAGDTFSGKSCLATAFSYRKFVDHAPTPATDALENESSAIDLYVSGAHMRLCIAEIDFEYGDGGGDGYDARVHSEMFAGADVVLLCCAVDRPLSIEHVRSVWVPRIRRARPTAVPVVLVATQTDLREDKGTLINLMLQGDYEPITPEQGQRLANEIGAAAYVECSAKTHEGVLDVFATASRVALLNRKLGRRKRRRNQSRDCRCAIL